jgi:hypothetical protein
LLISQKIARFDGNRPIYAYVVSSPEKLSIEGLDNALSIDDILSTCYAAGWDVVTLFRDEESTDSDAMREVMWRAILIKRRS